MKNDHSVLAMLCNPQSMYPVIHSNLLAVPRLCICWLVTSSHTAGTFSGFEGDKYTTDSVVASTVLVHGSVSYM